MIYFFVVEFGENEPVIDMALRRIKADGQESIMLCGKVLHDIITESDRRSGQGQSQTHYIAGEIEAESRVCHGM